MKNLVINPQIYDDLEEIKNYIAKDDENVALKVVKEIYSNILSLQDMPNRGANLQNKVKQKTKYKYILLYSYAILYYIDRDNIHITTIFHTAKDISALKL